MKQIVTICILAVASFVVAEEDLSLTDKKVENAMHAIFGEDPPHDIPLDYENPSLHDKLVSKQRADKKEREREEAQLYNLLRAAQEEDMRNAQRDHAVNKNETDHTNHDHAAHKNEENQKDDDHSAHADHNGSDNKARGNDADRKDHGHDGHKAHDHSAHAGHDHSAHVEHNHSAHGDHDHSAHAQHDPSAHSNQGKNDHSAHGAQAHASHGGNDHSGHQMMMWFHGGYNEVILFDFWRINCLTGMIISCVIIFVMGALYEGLKWFRVYLTLCKKPKAQDSLPVVVTECSGKPAREIGDNAANVPLVNANSRSTTPEAKHPGPFSPTRLIQALLYIVQLVLAYWLMLIVMTYNTWLTIAVILGAGFGHWIFAALHLAHANGGETAESLATDACH